MIETIKCRCNKDYNQDQINAWISSAQRDHHWYQFIQQQYSLVVELVSQDELNNEIVGFSSIENGTHVYFMYIHKDYFGKGIATYLLNEMEVESAKLGHNKITADVSITALPFFVAKGFRVVKENNNQINQISIINYSMIKTNTVVEHDR